MDVAAGLRRQDKDGTLCENCVLDTARHAPAWAANEMPYVSLAEALAAALDAREHETGLHSKRVACHTMVLAKRFSDDAITLRQVYWGALLHDIGKIGTPDAILLKQGPLTPEEWKIMQQHPEIGRQILAGVPHLAQAAEIVLCHEERFDGSGYPQGLAGEAIPLWARLFAVIDTLDAMTSDRFYRKGQSFDNAKAEIRRMSGTQFDPVAVAAFLTEEPTLRKMVALKCADVPPQAEMLPSEKSLPISLQR
ncbi:response regulator [Sulfuricella denitrificans skB26]|uniref:Response regulator n=2 Tax=Sulfuricella denitrificans TaxID=649841 RepID=S6AD06_SULDS|nr:response regulator [Sulfuricella denitrificans skB26]